MVAATKTKSKAPPIALTDREVPRKIELALIDANPDNPRQAFDENELRALADSMTSITMMQPVYLEPRGGRFQLLAGERRWRAAQVAGWRTIAAYVVKVDGPTAVRIMVDENLQRTDLNPIEKARALVLLTKPTKDGGAGLTHEAAASRFGHKSAWASQQLSLLKLPEPWRDRIAAGDVNARMGRALAGYHNRADVLAAVELDRDKFPSEWASCQQFESRLEEIVGRIDGLAASALPQVNEPPVTLPLTRRADPVRHDEEASRPLDRVLALVNLLSLAELSELAAHIAALLRKAGGRGKASVSANAAVPAGDGR